MLPLEPAEAEADPWIGRVVDGRYRVLGRIGSGGMGVVYRVEHLRLGKMAAMKVLSPDTAGNAQMVQRFRLEAQAVSRLNHPNIVQTFDFGQWDGALYLIMEYVKGDDLSNVLKHEGALDFARAARFFVQVCSALTEAHDAGIIHRDLKPENLMLLRRRDGSEHAKVLDFGLAKLREREEAAAITSGAQILGTPYYMSPEQVRGEELDARADVYSLGATLYRVLTGTPPFQAPSPMSVLAKHLSEEVVPPRSRAPERALPAEADRIVLRAMAKTLAERYQSVSEIQQDLERALGALAAARRSASSAPAVAAMEATAGSVGEPATGVAAPAAPDGDVQSLGAARTLSLDEEELSEVADGRGDRLRRQDLEVFERSLRRRRVLRVVGVPVALVAAAAVAAVVVVRGTAEKAVSTESEPNNTPGYANLLASGVPVRGTIGKMLEGGHQDVDYFRIPAGHGARAISARLQGVPGVDLLVELFDSQGRLLAKADARGRGWGEWLQPTSIGPVESYLAVREIWIEGQRPTENLSEAYTLTAQWGPPQTGWEVEPNDWEAVATPLAAGQTVRGFLGDAEDKDWFAITPAASGRLTARVRVPAGLDVVLLPGAEGGGGTARTEARRAVNRQGPGGAEEMTVDASAGRPVLVGVARRLPPSKDPKRDPKELSLDGFDEPYELTTTSEPR